MQSKNVMIVLLAVVLVGVVGSALYFYVGPYKSLSEENQQLKRELEARQTSESKMVHEISQLKAALEETKGETAQKTGLIENLQAKMAELTETSSKVKREKETVMIEVDRLRKTLEESKSQLGELSRQLEGLKGEYQQRFRDLREQLVKRNGHIENLQKEARQLRQTIATLEADRKTLSQEAAELKAQLEESKSGVDQLSREIEAKGKKVQEVQEIHQILVKQLKQQIQQKEVRISALKEKLRIQLLNKILFNPGNARITVQGRGILRRVAEQLKKLSGIAIRVDGHTDTQPLSEAARAVYIDNLGLSVARAAAVARTLRTLGVDPKGLFAAGYSMYRPVARNETPEGRQQNRRVEILLVP